MMKNKATLKFKNFTAHPRSFWVRTKLARAGVTLCYARPAEAICLEISSAVATPSGVGRNLKSENFKSLNFKSRNAMSTNCEAGRYIDFSAYYNVSRDIRFSTDYGVGYGIRLEIDRDINFNAYRGINSSADYDINLVKGHGMNPSMDYYDIRLGADLDINSDRHCAINFKISNANLKANLADLKADLRTDFK